MARLFLLRFSQIAFKGIRKEKLILFINLLIFISIFALSSAIISIHYENKIDQIDHEIIEEEINIVVYTNQIQKTPLIIQNIQNKIIMLSSLDDYKNLIQLKNTDDAEIITGRDLIFQPFWILYSLSSYGVDQIEQSISDAVLVSSNSKDLKQIEIISNTLKKIRENLRIIEREKDIIENEWALTERENFDQNIDNQDEASDKSEYYKKFQNLNNKLSDEIQKQINILTEFNLNYFQIKKLQTEKKITDLEKELSNLTNKESQIILIAFILQFLIFLSVQYFEVIIEGGNEKRKRKK